MSCTPRLLTRLAADYLLDHMGEDLDIYYEDFSHADFEELRKDLTLELEGAITDRWIEWRNKQNGR